MLRLAASGIIVGVLLGAPAAQPQEPPPTLREPQGRPEQGRGETAAQQRPVFRGGTHFVRVDAYPTRDGKIVENLKPEDFEILEDGKLQQIDSLDFVRFDTFTPEAERRDPSTQREGFDLAADLRYRLFVIVTDLALSTSPGAFVRTNDVFHIQQPLVNFLDRILGSQDLFGFVTSRNSVKDLVLARKSTVTRSQLADMWRSSFIDKDEADQLLGCLSGSAPDLEALQLRHRADATYTLLRDLVRQLGSLRQERKNVVLATNLLPRWGPDQSLLNKRGPVLPRVGIAQGRLGTRDPMTVGPADETHCAAEFQRLALMDFDPRFRELLREARKDNVSFYVVTPGGLQAPATVGDMAAVKYATDDLISLAHETDGIAIVNTNDLNSGMKRIADDLAAYYVLGYYTTNTKFDGNLRNIKVRLKPSGTSVRARRQYRAPTEAEIAALAASASRPGGGSSGAGALSLRETALAALDEPAHSRKPDLPASTLIGEASVFRLAPRSAAQPVAILHFDRADRIRINWPLLAPTDGRVLRILDRAGRPLPVELPLTEDPATRGLSLAFPLAAFSRADYIVELTVTAGAVTERTLLALRIK